MTLSPQQVQNLSSDVSAFLKGYRNWRDAFKYHVIDLAAAAIPAQTQMFNVAAAPGVCNMEKINEVSYPLLIMALGVQIYGTRADVEVVAAHTEIVIQKDGKNYAPFPTNVLPGGSLNMVVDSGAAAFTLATHGMGDDLYQLDTPVSFEPGQSLRVILQGDGTAVGAITSVQVILRGLEARPVI